MNERSNGFTLLEVVVAMALLVMAFGGLIGLLILTQESKVNGKNNMIATYLAQEGLDIVRSVRDENYAEGPLSDPQPVDVFKEIFDDTGAPYSFTIDYTGDTSIAVQPTGMAVKNSPPLTLFNNFFMYSADPVATSTIFHRLITTTYYPSAVPPYLEVTSQVYWQFDNKQNTVTLKDELTAWRLSDEDL